jgi:hypothetical protein
VAGGLTVAVEADRVRRVLLLVPVLASLLLAVPSASGAEPAAGTVDRDHPSVSWTGSAPLQTAGTSGLGCQQSVPDPTCDRFALTIGALGSAPGEEPAPHDVLVAIATPDAAEGSVVEFDLYVYGPDGAEVGHGTELGSNDTVTLRAPQPGVYTVAVQSVLSTDPTATYDGSATVVDAGAEAPLDAESQCGMEASPELRDLDRQHDLGVVGVVGDPTAAADGLDTTEPIDLTVRVVLDGVTTAQADAIFAEAARSYAPLGIRLRAVGYQTHAFGTSDGLAIIRATKALFGGVRPAGADVVEALVGYDIQQLGQRALAGIADCIGGVAYADRAFLVAEGTTPTDVAIGPAVFDHHANPHVTAHEIGHLLGGQHHYANCVEGIAPSDVHQDEGTVEGSPCTLMFNAADFLGQDFGTLNGAIVRGSASRYARP